MSIATPAAKRKQDLNIPGLLQKGGVDVVITTDSRLSDARPAADVYAWAKASTKPSYSYSEIGGTHGNEDHGPVFITADGVTYGNLAGNGDVGTGTLQVARGNHTHSYLEENETITLSGAVTGSGTTSIVTTLSDGVVGENHLNIFNAPAGGKILSYHSTNGLTWVDPYSHPDYTETDLNTSLAQVIDTITVVNGHVNGITTRDLSPGDIGASVDTHQHSWTQITSKPSVFTPAVHGNTAHSSTYITTSGVTADALDGNGSIGTGNVQVARGDHNHNGIYYTETEMDGFLAGKSDTGHTHSYLSLTGGTVTGSTRFSNNLNYFGSTGSNLAEIHINTGIAGSPQIGFTDNQGDMSWAVGGDDQDNSFKIHGNASGTIPVINNLATPFFEITTGGDILNSGVQLVKTNDSRLSDARTPVSHNNTYHSTNYAAEAISITGGIGLSGGGNLTTNRIINVTFGTTNDTVCEGNDARLSNARTPVSHNNTYHSTNYAAEAIIITAGTGLSGGGNLTANRTINVIYGTTANTACEGDDSRLSDARPPTAHNHNSIYYTETETDSLLSGKSDTSHTHDGRYYTETETNNLLAGKSDTSHTHDSRYYTETELTNNTKDLAVNTIESTEFIFTDSSGTPKFKMFYNEDTGSIDTVKL